MEQLKDMRIGERRYINSIDQTVECMSGDSCKECAFNFISGCNNPYCEETGECNGADRDGGDDVFFKIIKTPEI